MTLTRALESIAGPQDRHIFLASCSKSPRPLKNSSSDAGSVAGRSGLGTGVSLMDRIGSIDSAMRLSWSERLPCLRHEHNAGGRDQQGAHVGVDQIARRTNTRPSR